MNISTKIRFVKKSQKLKSHLHCNIQSVKLFYTCWLRQTVYKKCFQHKILKLKTNLKCFSFPVFKDISLLQANNHKYAKPVKVPNRFKWPLEKKNVTEKKTT